nr:MAG: capsid protein [Crogonang virus 155]
MQVKVTETYDLSTQTNKMGFVGIHTPDGRLVYNLWSGLFKNFRKYQFKSCDVTMACASMLPADPLQIGTEAGDIAPQDMFNPILYKAVSNDSMSNLLNRLYAGRYAVDSSDVAQNSVVSQNDETFGYNSDYEVDQFAMYYGLLADTGGWKKAMPQAGLQMRGLRPLAFMMSTNQGQPSNGLLNPDLVWSNADVNSGTSSISSTSTPLVQQYIRGPTMRLPPMDTYVYPAPASVSGTGATTTPMVTRGTLNTATALTQGSIKVPVTSGNNAPIVPNLDTPDCFVAAIVLPPAKLNRLYYRMKVSWTIEFSGLRPDTDLTNWYGLALAGVQSYGSDYIEQTATIARASALATSAMVDTGDVGLNKVMEGVS